MEEKHQGVVTQVIGAVVDVQFAHEDMPAIRDLLYDDKALADIRANMRAMKARLEEESVAHIFSALAEKEARAG